MGSKVPTPPPSDGRQAKPVLSPPPPPRRYEGKLEGDMAILTQLLDDARKLERESLAKEIESGRFCRETDHMTDVCNCHDIAAFIRSRTK